MSTLRALKRIWDRLTSTLRYRNAAGRVRIQEPPKVGASAPAAAPTRYVMPLTDDAGTPSLPAVGPFTEYVRAAMLRATFKPLEDGTVWGEIPGLQGLWANADTIEECRAELQSVLEDWVLVGIALHHAIPPVDGIELRVGQAT